MTKIRVLAAQASNWLIAFDPGLLRLRSAIRILVTVVVSLVLLVALTRMIGQSVTVAMLGMWVSSMMAGISTIAGRRQQWLTTLLVLLLALGAATLGTLLVPYDLLGMGFIAILFIAVYLRRFGQRGMLLGMTACQVYFLLVTFGTLRPASITFAQLPWLIIALVIGILCGFVINVYFLRERPERTLRTMARALLIRICTLIDVLRTGLASGQGNGRLPRRLRHQLALVNAAAAMIYQQFAQLGSDTLFAGIHKDELARRLFDTELATEGLIAPTMAVVSGTLTQALRVQLAEMLGALRKALCADAAITSLQQVQDAAVTLATNQLADIQDGRWLALACNRLAEAVLRLRLLTGQPAPNQSSASSDEGVGEERAAQPQDERATAGTADVHVQNRPGSLLGRLLPTTRQALQVALAAALATLAGTVLSSHRWYWAVITAFFIFIGTASRGETLVKAWQRVMGTVAGVGIGVVLASLVGGNVVVSVVFILVAQFMTSYWAQANYSLMVLFLTTMLALLYGLLGEFSLGLLLTRLEETAIGALIGILVALFVLPTHTGETVRESMQAYLASLDDLVHASIGRLTDEPGEADLVAQSEALQERLQQLRAKAKPLVQGVAGIGAHRSVQRMMIGLLACTYSMRELSRLVEHINPSSTRESLRTTLGHAGAQISATIETFSAALSTRQPPSVQTAEEQLASAEDTIRQQYREEEQQRLLGVVRALRAIDQAMVSLAGGDLHTFERETQWR